MRPSKDPGLNLLPLREPTFLILLSLAGDGKHGYGILLEVESLSQGRVSLSTGTLYEALSRLLEQGLIERCTADGPADEDTVPNTSRRGKPRKSYRLTRPGRELLRAEILRMERLVAAVKHKLGEEWG